MSGWGRWFFHLAASARVARFGEGVRPRRVALPATAAPWAGCGLSTGGILTGGKLALASFAAV